MSSILPDHKASILEKMINKSQINNIEIISDEK